MSPSHMEKRVNCTVHTYYSCIHIHNYVVDRKYCKVELMYDLVEGKFCCVSEAVVKLILPYLLQ